MGRSFSGVKTEGTPVRTGITLQAVKLSVPKFLTFEFTDRCSLLQYKSFLCCCDLNFLVILDTSG